MFGWFELDRFKKLAKANKNSTHYHNILKDMSDFLKDAEVRLKKIKMARCSKGVEEGEREGEKSKGKGGAKGKGKCKEQPEALEGGTSNYHNINTTHNRVQTSQNHPAQMVYDSPMPNRMTERMIWGVDGIVKDRWMLPIPEMHRLPHPTSPTHGAPIQCTRGKHSKAFLTSCPSSGPGSVTFRVLEEVEKEVVPVEPELAPSTIPNPGSAAGASFGTGGGSSMDKDEHDYHLVTSTLASPNSDTCVIIEYDLLQEW
ncbi:hypothetical protein M422DRAFT_269525 [Sphaerobolus stellatus SS14]|uniref:Uncharacterized protein n=1 Tax=Sphaerobolus stellatus (strain SS14) TaxID=990650 RepID=A0A0C9U4D0_SPHS4|nr:hypothetical protein M422DRAFT_269525 [Sphaerobolus stellatus SS14]